VLCISDFVGDVMFSHNLPCTQAMQIECKSSDSPGGRQHGFDTVMLYIQTDLPGAATH